MTEPVWLSDALVTSIHESQIAEHGGVEGTRDAALLASALARPLQSWSFAETPPSLARLAAAYAFGIARNHPFIDGNKRTALVAAETFLELNLRRLMATDVECVHEILLLAAGSISEEELATWFEANVRN